MSVRRILASALACGLLAAALAPALAAAPAPSARVAGSYAFVYRVTNLKDAKATRWVYRIVTPCKAPCASFAVQGRLTSEKKERAFVNTYRWNGKGFRLVKTLHGASTCVGRGGKRIKRGYDIVSSQSLKPSKIARGLVVAMTGSGLDD